MNDEQEQTPYIPSNRGDGFRARRKRPKGWLDKAIKDGSVRDPALGVDPPRVYPESTVVVGLPTVDASAKGREG